MCAQPGLLCRDKVLFGSGGGLVATAAALSTRDYLALRVRHAELAQVVREDGAPASPAALRVFFGSGSAATLAAAQPPTAACAYYLDSTRRSLQAFRLCFSDAGVLTSKALVVTSGPQAASSTSTTASQPQG